jgi:hypothetical protein
MNSPDTNRQRRQAKAAKEQAKRERARRKRNQRRAQLARHAFMAITRKHFGLENT